jgi:hypothetical protein
VVSAIADGSKRSHDNRQGGSIGCEDWRLLSAHMVPAAAATDDIGALVGGGGSGHCIAPSQCVPSLRNAENEGVSEGGW